MYQFVIQFVLLLLIVPNGSRTIAFQHSLATTYKHIGCQFRAKSEFNNHHKNTRCCKANQQGNDNLVDVSGLHTVEGIVCREVINELPIIGTITVLEATAESQEELVDEILELFDNDDDKENENDTISTGKQHVKSNHQQRRRIQKGDPYGAVLWPAAWAVANYIITTPSLYRILPDSSILELGTGTGLVSIAIAMAGAKRVLASDYEPLVLSLVSYAARLNGPSSKLNKQLSIETQLLDICDFETSLPTGFDIVVAADIMYEPKTGIAMAHRCVEALQDRCIVIVGDSPGRAGRPAFLQTLYDLGVEDCEFQETVGRTCYGPRHDLICGKGSMSVSKTPNELPVAIMVLKPSMLNRTKW